MARQTTITDDMDGSPNAETISYSFDGQDYEIDLSPENREKFRQALAPGEESGCRVDVTTSHAG